MAVLLLLGRDADFRRIASEMVRLFHDDRLFYKMGKNQKAGSLKSAGKGACDNWNNTAAPTLSMILVFPDLETLPDLDKALNVQRRIKTRVRQNKRQLQKVLEKRKLQKR